MGFTLPTYLHISIYLLARLYPKLRTGFYLSGKNLGFLANTFSTSQIIDEVQKVKLVIVIVPCSVSGCLAPSEFRAVTEISRSV